MQNKQNISNTGKKSLSIIIPVVNEERNIDSLVKRIFSSLNPEKYTYEVIFVDDHSTDKTAAVIQSQSAKYPVRLYSKRGKIGKAFSLLEGIGYAKYDLIAMIDADLQYPPEAIPEMVEKINDSTGVVIAQRKFKEISLIRKILSYGFSYFFVRLLHGMHHDVQSGLKVFKKEIIERISLSPGPWSFDLEFLLKAKHAGYGIANQEIIFEKRYDGKPKISLISAVVEIGLSALRLKLADHSVIPLHPETEKKKGKGFHFKGREFIHHSDLPNHESSFKTLSIEQKLFLLCLILVVAIGFVANWLTTAIILVALITIIYFIDLIFNLFLIIRSFTKQPEINIVQGELDKLKDKDLPVYTVFCPLYKEWEVLPQFVTAMSRLDYPKDKLQVLLLLEEDDKETIRHAQSYNLPEYFKLIVVPDSLPKTKPKALNYGLKSATGEYVVIYDAEDIPDPDQLKKVIAAFKKEDKKTVCIQAKLNFYNPHHNLLTRIFTAEYSLWFDLILTGLQSLFAPIPLGGTSNHFRIKDLKDLKGWDSFNVTEDCDLGIRLAKRGYQTALINSETLEEANSDIPNWFRQRIRWIKGYIQTYLVHMRDPKAFLQNGQKRNFLAFQIIVGAKILSMFINPLMWVTTILYFAFRPITGPFIQQFFPAPILYMGVFSLVFGNFLYMYYYMIACVKRGHYELVKYVFFVPLYWLAMSIAAWQAVIQLIKRPHFWPKTIHGFHLDSDKIIDQATEAIGKKLVDTRLVTYPVDFNPAYAKVAKSVQPETWSKSTLSSGTLLLGAMMVGNFLNFLFNAYLGRSISFEDFGLTTLINTFWYLLSVFITSLGTTVNHRIAYISAKSGRDAAAAFLFMMVRKATKIFLVISIAWLILSPFLASFFRLQSILPLVLFTPVILLSAMSSLGNGYLHGNFYFLLIGVALILGALAKFASAYLFVFFKLNSYAYLAIPISALFSFVIVAIFVLLKIRKIKSFPKMHFGFPKQFYAASVLTSFSTSAFLTLDIILTQHFLTTKMAGEYAFLSLVGKMIYYFGSTLNVFMTPFVSRDLGSNRDPNKSFYRILAGTTLLTTGMYFVIGIFGHIFVPMLFGEKAYPILQYLPIYALAISFYVVSNSIISYHLIRHHYSFPATALILSLVMSLGITLFHNNIGEIANVILAASVLSLIILVSQHLLQRNGKFFVRNLIDLFGLLLPLPKTVPLTSTGKRILIFNWRDTKHRFSGGAEVYIHELAKRWVKAGHSVTLFCGNDGHNSREEVIDGVQIIRRGGFYFVYFWAILYYLIRFRGQYDVVIDSENGIPFFTPLYAQGKKFLLIHHVHQDVFRKSLIPPFSWIATFLELKLMPFVYKKIQTITVSPSSKKEILEKQLTDVEPIIIYNGVDLNKYKPAEKSKVPLVLYLGRLKYYKSLHVFIKAARNILEKMPSVQFVIAGDGEEKEKLVDMTKKLSIYDKVKFVGKVSEEEKIRLYQQAWVFVNPSFMEGWGITTIEANACGTPVVASDVPGLRDSVNNPHSGILVPYGSINEFTVQITKLLKDDSLRAKMSIEAMYWAKQFEWESSADKSLEILRS